MATTNMERSTVSELSSGPMDHHTLESSIITTFTEREFTSGQMEEPTRENGEQTRCTGRELSLGLMAANT